jgi:hypothetical protein
MSSRRIKWNTILRPRQPYYKSSDDFFYREGFIIEITPHGRKYFEELENRGRHENQERRVFISCGQYSENEKNLGRELVAAVDTLTSCNGYFAENQTSFEALSRHIFEALDKCAGFVAVMHFRGDVKTANGIQSRASVWIEQEIAIAAFLTQIYGKAIPVNIYIQKGIKREGVREQLLLNATDFVNDSEVLAHFREQLVSGKFNPMPDGIKR